MLKLRVPNLDVKLQDFEKNVTKHTGKKSKYTYANQCAKCFSTDKILTKHPED